MVIINCIRERSEIKKLILQLLKCQSVTLISTASKYKLSILLTKFVVLPALPQKALFIL